jgi:hypothetical protein
LLILSNGEAFAIRWNEAVRNYDRVKTTFSRQTVCKIMNSVDQAGFFDYDSSTFVRNRMTWYPPIQGPGSYEIQVNAWRSKRIVLPGLDTYIQEIEKPSKFHLACPECEEWPTILPAVQKTYALLNEIGESTTSGFSKYQPERVRVFVQETGGNEALSHYPVWPLTYPNFDEVIAFHPSRFENEEGQFDLYGETGIKILDFLDAIRADKSDYCITEVRQGDKLYSVHARPLLPTEYSGGLTKPLSDLICQPADGWIEIP